MVIILEGDVLPKCHRCGYQVQFSPMIAGELIAQDPDFTEATEGAAAS
jgi:hypothetical protein